MRFLEDIQFLLSTPATLRGSIANALFNVRKRHPRADRPVIDWDIILVRGTVSRRDAGALARE